MAVNGVEIKAGQKWRTRDNRIVCVEWVDSVDGDYPVVGFVEKTGSSCTYTLGGVFDIESESKADLVELIEDAPLTITPPPELKTTDANELAAETLQSLGWHFVGNCWVQDAPPEQQSFAQTAADIEALSKVSVSVRKPNSEQQSALDVQVDGNHYKDCAIQPVEFIHANGLDFFQGNIIKYATRHKAKNGAADLRKAIHYCQLALQLQYGESAK